MRYIIFLMLASIIFTGSVIQTYEHEVSREGASVITESLEMNLFMQSMPDGALSSMASACLRDDSLQCSVDVENRSLTISRDFGQGKYYSFSAEYGIPYINYHLRIMRLPNDRFSSAMENIMSSAGLPVPSGITTEPVNLEDNMKMGNALKDFDLEIEYVVDMPGDITDASAGEYRASSSGSQATFMISDVLLEQSTIEVRSRELNSVLLVGLAAVIAIGALATSFFLDRKKDQDKKRQG